MSGIEAGAENVGRLKGKLRRHEAAMSALIGAGLTGASIERLHLGMRDPYRSRVTGVEVSDAVCFPLLSEGMRPVGRYAYMNLRGVTRNAPRERTWGPGSPATYRLGSFAPDAVALVCPDVFEAWLLWQAARGGHPELAFVSRSHAEGWPPDWREPSIWARFSRVVILPGSGANDFMLDVAHRIGREVERAALPPGHDDLRAFANDPARPSLDELLRTARPCDAVAPAAAATLPDDILGRFEAAPVEITGAYRGGHAFYPFAVERRAMEDGGRGEAGRVVQSYETLVLRSDGHLLSTERLPAPTGTPAAQRVLALSDGMRIVGEPAANTAGSWSFASIQRFVAWRRDGGEPPFRPLAELLRGVEAVLRGRVWLPIDEHYAMAACYVALSHCYRAFEAIPVLLITGARGTGKSELGEAIASVAFHATVASQMRAAGMIRLLDETRGLVVLDDMDGGGQSALTGIGELIQAIKCGYKQATARKPIADRGGRIRMVDFFSPKVITNTRSVDAIVGSRVFVVRTAASPPGVSYWDDRVSNAAISSLRDELHCWAMAAADRIHDVYLEVGRGCADRRAEIAAPLRAIARLAGDEALAARIEAALANPLTAPSTEA